MLHTQTSVKVLLDSGRKTIHRMGTRVNTFTRYPPAPPDEDFRRLQGDALYARSKGTRQPNVQDLHTNMHSLRRISGGHSARLGQTTCLLGHSIVEGAHALRNQIRRILQLVS